MNWWTIVKQGKILTLPKTQLRIKKPSKIEEDRTCKDKLIQLNEKLKNRESILETIFDIWQQEDYMNTKYWDIEKNISPHPLGKASGRKIRIKPSKDNPKEAYGQFGGLEQIWYLDKNTIEKLPEKICCTILDLLNEVSENGGQVTKTIEGWTISSEYLIDEHLESNPVEHAITSHSFALDVYYSGDGDVGVGGMVVMLYAPSDWIEGYDIDWR